MTASIVIVDYGMGNRRSVEKALEHVGARAVVTSQHELIRAADGLILPGVGAFPQAMANLASLGLDEVLRERHERGTPLLGLCLGMQLAFERSTEHGGAAGLGFVPGAVEPLAATGLKVPHIGWNLVTWRRASPLTQDLPQPGAFYHVHSLAPRLSDPADALGTCDYGGEFVTAVERGSFYGVQFHPEKSSAQGLRLLRNFAGICARRIAAAAAA